MPAGSRPGERRGGRKKGTKNMRTVAKEAEASAVHEKAYELGPLHSCLLPTFANKSEK
jgi:hypothetical protein